MCLYCREHSCNTHHITLARLQHNGSRRIDAALQVLARPHIVEHQHAQSGADRQHILLKAGRPDAAAAIPGRDLLHHLQRARIEQQRVRTAADRIQTVRLVRNAHVVLAVGQLSGQQLAEGLRIEQVNVAVERDDDDLLVRRIEAERTNLWGKRGALELILGGSNNQYDGSTCLLCCSTILHRNRRNMST